MSHHKQPKDTKDQQFEFPSKTSVNNFLQTANPQDSHAWKVIKSFAYPTFLILGSFFSIHYAINPVGNARRMIMENRMNPVLLRVKHALPFVFLGLLYKQADDAYYLKKAADKKENQRRIEQIYKGFPDAFRQ